MRPEVGQVINNKYRLIRLVGDGGMGSVYEARHELLGTTVALKFLHPELSRRAGLVQRFLQEARVSAHIQSPHVVRVSDVDQTGAGLAFMVMEYLHGKTLQSLYEDLYRQRKRLAYVDALEYAMQMLEGVEAAHKSGVVHRDLKPDNVIITQGLKGETRIVLLDFGIAKLKVTGELDRGLTRPGVMMGTPEYMAPEQVYSADAVDARADIFSLGVIIFEMLAGRRPVGGEEPHSIARAYNDGQIAKLGELVPNIDAALARAVHKAMAAKVDDRFTSVAAMRAAIEPAARAARVPSLATPTPEATPPPTAAAPHVDPLAQTNLAQPSPIPKTLPPEADEGETNAAAPPPTEAAPVPHGTPLGGLDAPAPATPAALASAPALAMTPDASGDEAAAPSPIPATNFDRGPATEAVQPRVGGTDVERSVSAGPPPTVDAGPNPTAAPAALAPPPPAALQPRAQVGRKASQGLGVVAILLIAGGVSAAVMGGLYVAHKYSQERSEEGGDVEPTIPTPTVVPTPSEPTTGPTGTAEPPIPTTPVPVPTPTPTQTNKPKPTGTPAPKPNADAHSDTDPHADADAHAHAEADQPAFPGRRADHPVVDPTAVPHARAEAHADHADAHVDVDQLGETPAHHHPTAEEVV
jgi:serine/threonine protein kinase